MPFSPKLARAISNLLGGPAVGERAERLQFTDAGHGYDRFGMHPDFIALSAALTDPLYSRYFRVQSHGSEHIPRSGAAVLASNHSGTLPIDGAMLYQDVYRQTDPPRAPRAVADYFVSSMPFISTLFARAGVVGGSRGNARALLQAGELLMIFPEGVGGIGKRFRDRYRLQRWSVGHAELAIRYRAPVVPVAVIGAEEQMPQLFRIPAFPGSPLPYIPVPATPIPLPVRYHIHYGPPLRFDQEFRPADADDPDLVRDAARRVKAAVQGLINTGLDQREGVFT